MMAKSKYKLNVRLTLAMFLVAALGIVSSCGMAAGQLCGPCGGVPVAIAGPGLSIASSDGVTACAGVMGATVVADGVIASTGPGYAIASAGGVTADAGMFCPASIAGLSTTPIPGYGLYPYSI